ncbi:ribosome small subunit-dependent GTPase A [Lactobacillus bombicola]|uniref:Small ribosomal subunit biogenesis GTPase RsgA n=1 Tax=Lactobacillus bombicola TaxID=1505723 RepID=A0ABX9LSU3_9LACO|nr:ribosome small subunit-dependent GTPase A [Lactobacillus bombicola]RHW49263.1 ribosome small subunit-dependent GTPase A [Lactobacillus bombicola]
MDLGLSTYKQHMCVNDVSTLGRITLNSSGMFKVMHLDGSEYTAIPKNRTEHFLVGDWVSLDSQSDFDLINYKLPRYSTLQRITGEKYQVQEKEVASNIDQLFICISMNKNFKMTRIKRYIYAFKKDEEYQTALVFTKSDLNQTDTELAAKLANELDIPVFLTSSVTGEGIEDLQNSIFPGQTISFYGNSGVGKSTLINSIAQEDVMSTGQISEKTDKGRHTTTNSRLLTIDHGDFILIDTPGIKSVGIGTNDMISVFPEIVELGKKCRFRNCNHRGEPGCAVLSAVKQGHLDSSLYEQFVKLDKESQTTQSYIDTKTAKKLSRKAEGKKEAISKRQYRKPPM